MYKLMGIFIALIQIFFCMAINKSFANEKLVVRVGHFPNVTHAQGLIGHQLSRQKKGWFEKRLGPDVEIQWYVYSSGPDAMEAIFADSIDLTYVGPSPTINAYLKSHGKEIRIISGACSGGAALIVQPDGQIKTVADFRGKKIGTPEFGSTQDVAARAWLISKGFHIALTGGDAMVIPTVNSEQLSLFQTKGLDAVWTVEPWVSQIVLQANGHVYLEEKTLWPETNGNYVTTHLVSSEKFLEKHQEAAKKFVKAHVELTEWINTNRNAAKDLLRQELKAETHFSFPDKVLDRAWDHIELTYDPIPFSLHKYAKEAFLIGFLKEDPNLKRIYDLHFLNEVLTEQGKKTVSD